MRRAIGLLSITLLGLIAAGCGSKNEFPEDYRGTYTRTRLLADDYTIVVEANGVTVSECEINCPNPSISFTRIECRPMECTLEGPDCTGTVSRSVDGTLSFSLNAVDGATGDELERRQTTCFQLSGSASSPG